MAGHFRLTMHGTDRPLRRIRQTHRRQTLQSLAPGQPLYLGPDSRRSPGPGRIPLPQTHLSIKLPRLRPLRKPRHQSRCIRRRTRQLATLQVRLLPGRLRNQSQIPHRETARRRSPLVRTGNQPQSLFPDDYGPPENQSHPRQSPKKAALEMGPDSHPVRARVQSRRYPPALSSRGLDDDITRPATAIL